MMASISIRISIGLGPRPDFTCRIEISAAETLIIASITFGSNRMAAHINRTIAVTGVTGKQGGAAFRHLRNRGFALRALARNPEKPEIRELEGSRVEVLRADFDDPESMQRALDGADGAYSVQPSQGGSETEIRQGIAFAEAANQQEVGHFVYSSVAAAGEDTGIPHFESKGKIEERIRQIGMPYTIFRPVFFMENWQMMRDGIDKGTIMLPFSPQTRLQMIAVDDIGAFITLAFEHPGHWHNRAYELAGDEFRSMRWRKRSAAPQGAKCGINRFLGISSNSKRDTR